VAQQIADKNNQSRQMTVNEDGSINTILFSSLIPNKYDFIDLTYTGSNPTTIVYKIGGAGGITVATLILTYSGDNVLTITRS